MLHVDIDVAGVAAALPFEDTLRDRRDGGVMPLLYSFKRLCKIPVVLAHFRRPGDARSVSIVAGGSHEHAHEAKLVS